jgi:hypothetical protein
MDFRSRFLPISDHFSTIVMDCGSSSRKTVENSAEGAS